MKKRSSKKSKSASRSEINSFISSDAFLDSYEWRKLRLKILIRDGRVCACCGATPKSGAVMNVDHIKPRKTHPWLALAASNLQVLCSQCNHGKGNHNTTDFRRLPVGRLAIADQLRAAFDRLQNSPNVDPLCDEMAELESLIHSL